VRRGEIWWASLPEPAGSGRDFRRPLLLVSANHFNDSRISTILGAVITSNLRLADAPGNVRLPVKGTRLTKASVVNVSQIITVDKTFLTRRIGKLSARQLVEVDEGLRLVFSV